MRDKKIKFEKDSESGIFNRFTRLISDKIYDCQVALHKCKKPKKGNNKKDKNRQLIFYIGWISIPLLQLAIFYFYVNANSILMAFQRYDVHTNGFKWAGLANFQNLIKSFTETGGALRISLINSLVIFFCKTVIGVSLALFFSYYIYKKLPAAELFRVVLFLPHVVSSIVMVIVFKYFTESAIPGLVHIISGEKISGFLSNAETQFGTVVFFNVWAGFGTNVLMYVSAMSRIPSEITEAAELDGITPMREFILIVLPMIYPTITAFMIIGMTDIFTSNAYIYEFFGERLSNQKLYTMGYYLLKFVISSEGTSAYPFASAAGVVMTLIATPVILGVKKLLEMFDPSTEA